MANTIKSVLLLWCGNEWSRSRPRPHSSTSFPSPCVPFVLLFDIKLSKLFQFFTSLSQSQKINFHLLLINVCHQYSRCTNSSGWYGNVTWCNHCGGSFRLTRYFNIQADKNVKYSPYRPSGPWGFWWVKAPEFLDTRHMKVVRSSPAVFTLRNMLVLIFRGWVDPGAHGTAWCPGKNPQWPGIDPGTSSAVP